MLSEEPWSWLCWSPSLLLPPPQMRLAMGTFGFLPISAVGLGKIVVLVPFSPLAL